MVWLKRVLLSLHLANFFVRFRGNRELSGYTGGWNATLEEFDPSKRRLNLGSGRTHYNGFINLDVEPTPFVHVQAVGQMMPFPSESFDEVLCVDVIEHLDAPAGQLLLDETLRVLRQGGHLILVTPDLEDIVRAFQSGFATYDQTIQHLLGDARDHRYLYTLPSLIRCLHSSGFTIDRTIRHWGPIWAHTMVLAER